MRSWLMLSLLGVNAWAGACSPIAPSDNFLKASKVLLESTAKNQSVGE